MAVVPTAVHRFCDALLDSGDELPRYRAANDLVFKLEALAAIDRLYANARHSVLAMTTGLLLVLTLRLSRRGDRLAVRNPHILGAYFHAELALETLECDREVRLSRAGE